jgi:hypothetical protein
MALIRPIVSLLSEGAWSAWSVRRLLPVLGAVGCGVPPLEGDSGASSSPSIRFVFPTSELSAPVCSDFVVAVDIDHFNLVPPNGDAAPVDGSGHWHLDDDITGDYLVVEDPFVDVTADLDGQTARNYRLTATLVNINHAPLSQESFPQSVTTVEFEVSDTPDCIGGGGAASGR